MVCGSPEEIQHGALHANVVQACESQFAKCARIKDPLTSRFADRSFSMSR